MIVLLATDGSSLRDSKTSTGETFICAAGYVLEIYEHSNLIYSNSVSKSLGRSTSNKAEFTALIMGLEEIITKGYDQLSRVIIISDSEYVINCVTKWYYTWRKDKSGTPKTSTGTPVKNFDLIQKAYLLFNSLLRGGTFVKIKSHMKVSEYEKEYKKFKIKNGNFSYLIFDKFRTLNERVDDLVNTCAHKGETL